MPATKKRGVWAHRDRPCYEKTALHAPPSGLYFYLFWAIGL
ncbi:hypothetical protein QUB63_21260 [Microcoleus sp. ARI1-B5]